jgi:copper chaperone
MIESVVLSVNGMKCGGCETIVKDTLGLIDGIVKVEPSFKEKKVSVEFDGEKTTLDAINTAITSKGFTLQNI